jgi:hypothetical protein
MPTKFPLLAKKLWTSRVRIPAHARTTNNTTDPVTIRTGDLVAGLLLLSEIHHNNPNIQGRIQWELCSIEEDLQYGIDYRIKDYKWTLYEIDFTFSSDKFRSKSTHCIWLSRKRIVLIHGWLLLGVMHLAEEYCAQNPWLYTPEVIKSIPWFKRSSQSIVIKTSAPIIVGSHRISSD